MKIVGVAACTAGIAHTYMAKEKLMKGAKARGHEVKVETQGTIGIEDELTEEDIRNADVVILAVDVKISGEERFKGKPLIRVGTNTVLKNPVGLIEKVEKAVGKLPKKMSCRYNPGGIFKISNDIMDNPGDSKYGMTTEQIFEAFRIMKAKGVEEFGIHAFLASNTVTNDYYSLLAQKLFELAVRLKEEVGVHIGFINLSGGVGIPYRPDQEPNDIRVIGKGVEKVYNEILVPAGMGDVAIYTELGRFMMGPYGCLVTKAINEKHTYKEYIGVDACAVNLMRPAMYGAYHHITVMGKEDQPCDHMYDVTGSLCENNDKFAIDRMLPKVDMGDLLVIHDTGAHGFSMGYNYNGKLKSAEVLLTEDGEAKLIRRAETPKDYFATFDCFDFYKKVLE